MTATALPAAATRAARLLVATHLCVDCRALPMRPFDPADVQARVEYRPNAPRPAPHGGPRSRRCTTHHRAANRARTAGLRSAHKTRRFGLSAELQQALWVFQGSSCPCGRKAAPEVPAGVTLHHDRGLAQAHDHPDEQGCLDCVGGYLCPSCNRDVVGRLERTYRNYDRVAAALHGVGDFLTNPPLARLLAVRPDLRDEGP